MRTSWTLGLALLSFAVACGSSDEERADDSSDFGALDEAELRGRALTIPDRGEKAFTFNNPSAGPVTVEVDCGVSPNPDEVGNVFKVDAPALSLPSNETDKAAFFSWSGEVASGSHTVTLKSVRGGARCTVKVGRTTGAGSCKSFKSYRSPITDATHIGVGQAADNWEPFPASGNHWGAWAAWNQAYAKPVKRGFTLHNLEHGGAVLSYKCAADDESAECTEAANKLKALVEDGGFNRTLITPDPDQPTKFAIRTWRTVHVADCLSDSEAKKFLQANLRHGREDIDADPPVPFDPTTTNVPCQDLMAAPDSCF